MLRMTFMIALVITSLQNSFAQKETVPGFIDIPAGNVIMSKHSFKMMPFSIGKTEVSNKEYQQFLVWLKKNESAEMVTMTTPFLPKDQLKLLPKNYLKSKKYENYPVVGITAKAADLYCKYLSKQNPELKGIFRLPSEREWVYASRGGNDLYKYSTGMALINQENQPVCNYKKTGKKPAPMPVDSYKPNGFGLYNMSGNVAEWISVEGRTRGGSWNDDEEFLDVTGKDPYMGLKIASPFVGFRVLWISQ